MALNFVGTQHGSARNLTKPILLYNSLIFVVGEAVETFTNGYATHATAAKPFKGIIHAIVDRNGLPILKGASVPGTASSPDTNTVTTASDNTTTQLYWVIVDTSEDSIYSAKTNGTIGTTVSSNLMGAKININSAGSAWGEVLESTATRTVATTANFYSYGTDPSDSTRLLVSLANSEERSVTA